MKKSVSIFLNLKGDWTSKEKTERIMRIEGIPMHADYTSFYNKETKETWISIVYTQEREVNSNGRV